MSKMIFFLKFFALLRAFFYLYITIESFLLAYMYWNAYKKYKTTPIIKALQIVLLTIGLNFFYMTFLAMTSFIDKDNIIYDFLISFMPIVQIPIIYSLVNFRQKSTEEVSKNGHRLIKSYKLKK